VLDIGCGCGRIALPLTEYLGQKGAYEGFDIVPEAISWCRDHISTRYPNFQFRVADIFNGSYNPEGRLLAEEYVFPYEDEAFDFAILTSVFTHMLPESMDHYLKQLSRVLKGSGRCLLTMFLVNEESSGLMEAGSSTLDFENNAGVYRTHIVQTPEAAVAYEEEFVARLLDTRGFDLVSTHYGAWPGRASFLAYQDLLIARRRT